MNLYSISQAILGTLPSEFTFLYGLLTFIIAVLSVLLLLFPFVLVFKLMGGK